MMNQGNLRLVDINFSVVTRHTFDASNGGVKMKDTLDALPVVELLKSKPINSVMPVNPLVIHRSHVLNKNKTILFLLKI
jgi:hypothetical protein